MCVLRHMAGLGYMGFTAHGTVGVTRAEFSRDLPRLSGVSLGRNAAYDYTRTRHMITPGRGVRLHQDTAYDFTRMRRMTTPGRGLALPGHNTELALPPRPFRAQHTAWTLTGMQAVFETLNVLAHTVGYARPQLAR